MGRITSTKTITLDLVRDMYRAIEDASVWDSVARGIASLANCPVGLLYVESKNKKQFALAATVGVDDAILRAYSEYYHLIDRRFRPVREKLSHGILTDTSAYVSNSEWIRSEVYNDLYRHLGTLDAYGSKLLDTDTYVGGVGLHRALTSGAMSRAEMKRVQAVLPHLEQSLKLFLTLAGSRTKVNVQNAALDQLRIGFIAVAKDALVLTMNRAAEHLIRIHDGIALSGGRLVAGRADETNKLQMLVRAASQTSERKGFSPGGDMRVTRDSGQAALVVSVTPLHVDRHALMPGAATALISVADPEQRPELPHETLQRLFSLTRAEAKLASHLATGASLRSYLEAAEISHETARQHLKHIFSKTDTHRQADLIRALLMTLGGIRHPN